MYFIRAPTLFIKQCNLSGSLFPEHSWPESERSQTKTSKGGVEPVGQHGHHDPEQEEVIRERTDDVVHVRIVPRYPLSKGVVRSTNSKVNSNRFSAATLRLRPGVHFIKLKH